MRNSLIYFKKGASTTFKLNEFDCCQSLGAAFKDKAYSSGEILFVGIPNREMDDFFMVNNKKNLASYLELITNIFDIQYSIATEEEVKQIDDNMKYPNEDSVFIKIICSRTVTNKYFNVAFNMLRYLWYQHYTNIAIIATNLYKMRIIEDVMDIIAIAFSYQGSNERAVLPTATTQLTGLLFFRTKQDIQKELSVENTHFNSVFYKYPIYFDPIVKVKGAFFAEVENVIKAKELFSKLSGVVDIEDIPKSTLNNIRIIYDDYLLMKESYNYIKGFLDKDRLAMSASTALLLSKELSEVRIKAVDPAGNGRTLAINLFPKSPIDKALDEIHLDKPIPKFDLTF
jgi:hypothetical protein